MPSFAASWSIPPTASPSRCRAPWASSIPWSRRLARWAGAGERPDLRVSHAPHESGAVLAPWPGCGGRRRGGAMAAEARLLLVEDDRAMVELLRYTLEKQGFEVVHTPSGEEALLLAVERGPDLILLDWMLEELSG